MKWRDVSWGAGGGGAASLNLGVPSHTACYTPFPASCQRPYIYTYTQSLCCPFLTRLDQPCVLCPHMELPSTPRSLPTAGNKTRSIWQSFLSSLLSLCVSPSSLFVSIFLCSSKTKWQAPPYSFHLLWLHPREKQKKRADTDRCKGTDGEQPRWRQPGLSIML